MVNECEEIFLLRFSFERLCSEGVFLLLGFHLGIMSTFGILNLYLTEFDTVISKGSLKYFQTRRVLCVTWPNLKGGESNFLFILLALEDV